MSNFQTILDIARFFTLHKNCKIKKNKFEFCEINFSIFLKKSQSLELLSFLSFTN